MNINILFMLLISIFLYSCGGGTSPVSTEIPDPDPESIFKILQINHNRNNQQINNIKQTKIIRDQETFNNELKLYSDDTPEIIDFDKGSVLIIDLGIRAVGFNTKIISIDVADIYVTANINFITLGLECAAITISDHFFQFVYIPTKKDILISEQHIYSQCHQ